MSSRRNRRTAGAFVLVTNALLVVALSLASACSDDPAQSTPAADTATPFPTDPLSLDERVQVRVGDLLIDAEAARTVNQRAQGLSDRESLAPGTGMLFVFESERIPGFHMNRMHFPLDFVWISADLRVVDLTENVPFPASASEDPAQIQPESAVQYVLEVNAGVIAANEISIGDEVSIEGINGETDAIGQQEYVP